MASGIHLISPIFLWWGDGGFYSELSWRNLVCHWESQWGEWCRKEGECWGGGCWEFEPCLTHSLGKWPRPFMQFVLASCRRKTVILAKIPWPRGMGGEQAESGDAGLVHHTWQGEWEEVSSPQNMSNCQNQKTHLH